MWAADRFRRDHGKEVADVCFASSPSSSFSSSSSCSPYPYPLPQQDGPFREIRRREEKTFHRREEKMNLSASSYSSYPPPASPNVSGSLHGGGLGYGKEDEVIDVSRQEEQKEKKMMMLMDSSQREKREDRKEQEEEEEGHFFYSYSNQLGTTKREEKEECSSKEYVAYNNRFSVGSSMAFSPSLPRPSPLYRQAEKEEEEDPSRSSITGNLPSSSPSSPLQYLSSSSSSSLPSPFSPPPQPSFQSIYPCSSSSSLSNSFSADIPVSQAACSPRSSIPPHLLSSSSREEEEEEEESFPSFSLFTGGAGTGVGPIADLYVQHVSVEGCRENGECFVEYIFFLNHRRPGDASPPPPPTTSLQCGEDVFFPGEGRKKLLLSSMDGGSSFRHGLTLSSSSNPLTIRALKQQKKKEEERGVLLSASGTYGSNIIMGGMSGRGVYTPDNNQMMKTNGGMFFSTDDPSPSLPLFPARHLMNGPENFFQQEQREVELSVLPSSIGFSDEDDDKEEEEEIGNSERKEEEKKDKEEDVDKNEEMRMSLVNAYLLKRREKAKKRMKKNSLLYPPVSYEKMKKDIIARQLSQSCLKKPHEGGALRRGEETITTKRDKNLVFTARKKDSHTEIGEMYTRESEISVGVKGGKRKARGGGGEEEEKESHMRRTEVVVMRRDEESEQRERGGEEERNEVLSPSSVLLFETDTREATGMSSMEKEKVERNVEEIGREREIDHDEFSKPISFYPSPEGESRRRKEDEEEEERLSREQSRRHSERERREEEEVRNHSNRSTPGFSQPSSSAFQKQSPTSSPYHPRSRHTSFPTPLPRARKMTENVRKDFSSSRLSPPSSSSPGFSRDLLPPIVSRKRYRHFVALHAYLTSLYPRVPSLPPRLPLLPLLAPHVYAALKSLHRQSEALHEEESEGSYRSESEEGTSPRSDHGRQEGRRRKEEEDDHDDDMNKKKRKEAFLLRREEEEEEGEEEEGYGESFRFHYRENHRDPVRASPSKTQPSSPSSSFPLLSSSSSSSSSQASSSPSLPFFSFFTPPINMLSFPSASFSGYACGSAPIPPRGTWAPSSSSSSFHSSSSLHVTSRGSKNSSGLLGLQLVYQRQRHLIAYVSELLRRTDITGDPQVLSFFGLSARSKRRRRRRLEVEGEEEEQDATRKKICMTRQEISHLPRTGQWERRRKLRDKKGDIDPSLHHVDVCLECASGLVSIHPLRPLLLLQFRGGQNRVTCGALVTHDVLGDSPFFSSCSLPTSSSRNNDVKREDHHDGIFSLMDFSSFFRLPYYLFVFLLHETSSSFFSRMLTRLKQQGSHLSPNPLRLQQELLLYEGLLEEGRGNFQEKNDRSKESDLSSSSSSLLGNRSIGHDTHVSVETTGHEKEQRAIDPRGRDRRESNAGLLDVGNEREKVLKGQKEKDDQRQSYESGPLSSSLSKTRVVIGEEEEEEEKQKAPPKFFKKTAAHPFRKTSFITTTSVSLQDMVNLNVSLMKRYYRGHMFMAMKMKKEMVTMIPAGGECTSHISTFSSSSLMSSLPAYSRDSFSSSLSSRSSLWPSSSSSLLLPHRHHVNPDPPTPFMKHSSDIPFSSFSPSSASSLPPFHPSFSHNDLSSSAFSLPSSAFSSHAGRTSSSPRESSHLTPSQAHILNQFRLFKQETAGCLSRRSSVCCFSSSLSLFFIGLSNGSIACGAVFPHSPGTKNTTTSRLPATMNETTKPDEKIRRDVKEEGRKMMIMTGGRGVDQGVKRLSVKEDCLPEGLVHEDGAERRRLIEKNEQKRGKRSSFPSDSCHLHEEMPQHSGGDLQETADEKQRQRGNSQRGIRGEEAVYEEGTKICGVSSSASYTPEITEGGGVHTPDHRRRENASRPSKDSRDKKKTFSLHSGQQSPLHTRTKGSQRSNFGGVNRSKGRVSMLNTPSSSSAAPRSRAALSACSVPFIFPCSSVASHDVEEAQELPTPRRISSESEKKVSTSSSLSVRSRGSHSSSIPTPFHSSDGKDRERLSHNSRVSSHHARSPFSSTSTSRTVSVRANEGGEEEEEKKNKNSRGGESLACGACPSGVQGSSPLSSSTRGHYDMRTAKSENAFYRTASSQVEGRYDNERMEKEKKKKEEEEPKRGVYGGDGICRPRRHRRGLPQFTSHRGSVSVLLTTDISLPRVASSLPSRQQAFSCDRGRLERSPRKEEEREAREGSCPSVLTLLISAGRDRQVYVHHGRTGELLVQQEISADGAARVGQIDESLSLLFFGCEDGSICIYRIHVTMLAVSTSPSLGRSRHRGKENDRGDVEERSRGLGSREVKTDKEEEEEVSISARESPFPYPPSSASLSSNMLQEPSGERSDTKIENPSERRTTENRSPSTTKEMAERSPTPSASLGIPTEEEGSRKRDTMLGRSTLSYDAWPTHSIHTPPSVYHRDERKVEKMLSMRSSTSSSRACLNERMDQHASLVYLPRVRLNIVYVAKGGIPRPLPGVLSDEGSSRDKGGERLERKDQGGSSDDVHQQEKEEERKKSYGVCAESEVYTQSHRIDALCIAPERQLLFTAAIEGWVHVWRYHIEKQQSKISSSSSSPQSLSSFARRRGRHDEGVSSRQGLRAVGETGKIRKENEERSVKESSMEMSQSFPFSSPSSPTSLLLHRCGSSSSCFESICPSLEKKELRRAVQREDEKEDEKREQGEMKPERKIGPSTSLMFASSRASPDTQPPLGRCVQDCHRGGSASVFGEYNCEVGRSEEKVVECINCSSSSLEVTRTSMKTAVRLELLGRLDCLPSKSRVGALAWWSEGSVLAVASGEKKKRSHSAFLLPSQQKGEAKSGVLGGIISFLALGQGSEGPYSRRSSGGRRWFDRHHGTVSPYGDGWSKSRSGHANMWSDDPLYRHLDRRTEEEEEKKMNHLARQKKKGDDPVCERLSFNHLKATTPLGDDYPTEDNLLRGDGASYLPGVYGSSSRIPCETGVCLQRDSSFIALLRDKLTERREKAGGFEGGMVCVWRAHAEGIVEMWILEDEKMMITVDTAGIIKLWLLPPVK
ncbi:px domain protein [Cystoisospora suis]|uniref:Px domain protein n=1 Tax=Cystoisospora suis TaxID=483139 RepID=A0A2C6KND3_9APIC|nr:px domain protein [Cystoisospora suis]